jgi:peptide-methionine (S)-S-oxide reductase
MTKEPAMLKRRYVLTATAVGGALAILGAESFMAPTRAAEDTVVLPAPAVDQSAPPAGTQAKAVLAGGCFWGVQAVFQHVNGVSNVLSGYSGGTKESAQYEKVSSGRTGHAEAVEVTYDPSVVSYGTLLQIFFSVAHDPTQLNRQGPDVGTQYRSAIFTMDADQRRVAQAYVAQLDKSGAFKKPIVTKIDDVAAFYPAEAYHQDYATLHPTQGYIVYNDLPKIENVKRLYPSLTRSKPVLVSADKPKG